jgi:aryl-alcohol dehydrogenase-like predicted oxidoreductase
VSLRPSTQLVFGAGGLHRILYAGARQRLLGHAFELGFRSFDVAPSYGNGLNEVELGKAFGGIRHTIAITTKFGIRFDAYGERHRLLFPVVRAERKYLRRGYGTEHARRSFSKSAMVESLNASLRRLRCDYVDRLLVHEPLEPCSADLMGELIEQADRLKSQGKIRSFGVCGPPGFVEPFLGAPGLDVVQTPLWEIPDPGRVAGKQRVAYGVFRSFRNRPGRTSGAFVAYLAEYRREHLDLELIVSSTSRTTVASFGALFP